MNRRDFLTTTLKAGAACAGIGLLSRQAASAIEPLNRTGKARFRVSLVGYSFKKYLTDKDPSKKITLFDLIDYCAAQGFDGIELTSYYFEQPITPEYLIRLRRHAYLRGVAVSGTSMTDKFAQPMGPALDTQIAHVKQGVDNAAILGAPYLRVFAGRGKDMEVKANRDGCVAALQECAEYAGTKGVFIGLENDSAVTPDQTLDLVNAVSSPWFALNLDLGNFHTPDVYADLVRCAPYAVNVHFKMLVQDTGKAAVPADIPRLLKILSDARYQGYLALEYEMTGDPYVDVPVWLKNVREAVAGS